MHVHGNNLTTNMVFIHINALNINIDNFGNIEFLKKKLTECHTLYTVYDQIIYLQNNVFTIH